MKGSFRYSTLAWLVAALCGCTDLGTDPAGEARSRTALTDAEVAGLSEPLYLHELEKRFGAAEPQPGPRLTYRSADHAGQFFWVYLSSDGGGGDLQEWTVERIVRADRLEEGGIVVWPTRLVSRRSGGR